MPRVIGIFVRPPLLVRGWITDLGGLRRIRDRYGDLITDAFDARICLETICAVTCGLRFDLIILERAPVDETWRGIWSYPVKEESPREHVALNRWRDEVLCARLHPGGRVVEVWRDRE